MTHDINHVSGQRCDGDVEQKPHRHMIGFKVNPDHRADLKVNKQQQKIWNRCVMFLKQIKKCPSSSPKCGCTDGEQRKSVKNTHTEIAKSIELFKFVIHDFPLELSPNTD
jgi:enoyl-[acyl-carrier-protein] reductase (NADH)